MAATISKNNVERQLNNHVKDCMLQRKNIEASINELTTKINPLIDNYKAMHEAFMWIRSKGYQALALVLGSIVTGIISLFLQNINLHNEATIKSENVAKVVSASAVTKDDLNTWEYTQDQKTTEIMAALNKIQHEPKS